MEDKESDRGETNQPAVLLLKRLMALTLIMMDGSKGERERMRDGGEGEGEASGAVLWDRWAPGVRVRLSAPLSRCSPIAPHSRRLGENEGTMAACQRENGDFLKQSGAI